MERKNNPKPPKEPSEETLVETKLDGIEETPASGEMRPIDGPEAWSRREQEDMASQEAIQPAIEENTSPEILNHSLDEPSDAETLEEMHEPTILPRLKPWKKPKANRRTHRYIKS